MILSSLEVIKDLFEKRSSNYSDRKLNCTYHIPHLKELKIDVRCGPQDGWEYNHVVDAIRPVVAKTQEIISRVFSLYRGD